MVKTSDEQMARTLRQALRSDARIGASRIHVSFLNGKAVLAGTVPTHTEKLAAIITAQEMPGVRSVADRLRVSPRLKLSDEKIAAYVRRTLDARADIPEKTIAVNVKKGRCTLAGTVPSRAVWEAANEVVLGCKGVRSVRNLLVIDPESVSQDADIARHVQVLLGNQQMLDPSAITAKCVGGRVVLTGRVPSLPQKIQAGKVASRPPGVKQVINKLRVR
jgi:osmotically-inducible protein OsmY